MSETKLEEWKRFFNNLRVCFHWAKILHQEWTKQECILIVAGVRGWDRQKPITGHDVGMLNAIRAGRPYHFNCRCVVITPLKTKSLETFPSEPE